MGGNGALEILGIKAKEASYKLMNLSSTFKDNGLEKIKSALIENIKEILEANSRDIENAKVKQISEAMIDRLTLTEKRIQEMAEAIEQVISLPDPIGEVLGMSLRPNGLRVGKKRVPLGVIGIIYEARPNVTLDAAILCLKTGNAVILRGGSEAINSNIAIVSVIKKALIEAGLPESAVGIVEDTSRETANQMMKLNKYINVLIPRGGKGLINTVVNNSTIPVIETGVGNCHVYVDESADFEMAKKIIINAKTSRPTVCNALENVLINKNVAGTFVPFIFDSLVESHVEIRCCEDSLKIWEGSGTQNVKLLGNQGESNVRVDNNRVDNTKVVIATEDDYYTEFLDLIIAVKIVDNIEAGISHINKYGSGHSEAIITSNYERSQKFLDEVDSAAVYVNTSTRFTDGHEFGFGAEIGISTQKLHARGPMGLAELTTTKYVVYGNGQIR